MIAYASRTGTRRNLDALRARGWRIMVSAKGVLRTEGFSYALDNGAWHAFQQRQPFDDRAFMNAVEMLGQGADFVVAPDIVAGGMASLDFSLSWLPRLSGLRLLLPVQNGMERADIEHLVGPQLGIFVGGDTPWKESTLPIWGSVAAATGAYLHVGRVNSIRRIYLCIAARADSFDGSSASKYAVTLPKLDGARRQMAFVL